MKAVILAPLPPPSGGIASWANRMKTAELQNNWKVIIVDEKVIGGREVYGTNTKINFLVEVKRCFKIWIDLWRSLSDQDVKVVHSNIPAGFSGMLREVVCAVISKIRNRKFIIHYRCTIPNMVKTKKSKLMFRMLTGISDACIVLNKFSKEFAESCSKTPTYLIANFVSTSEIKKVNKELLNGSEVKCRALYVGGVIKEKGCLDIIEAAKRISNVEFRLVGSVSPEIKKVDIPSNVVLCGELDKQGVQRELAQADIFLFMSYFYGEGFSNALAEAMAYGLPCVVSDWAANADMVEECGGYVVPVQDIQGLCSGIEALAASKELRFKMGEWNLNKINKAYTQEKVTAKYVELYEELLKKSSK